MADEIADGPVEGGEIGEHHLTTISAEQYAELLRQGKIRLELSADDIAKMGNAILFGAEMPPYLGEGRQHMIVPPAPSGRVHKITLPDEER